MSPEDRFRQWEWLVPHYANKLCGKLNLDRDDAIGSAYLVLWRAVHQPDHNCWEAYLRKRVSGAIFDAARQWYGKSTSARSGARFVEVDPKKLSSTWPPEEAASYSKLHRALGRAKLNQRELSIITRHYIAEEPFQDIARSLGIAPSRVSQIHKRALLKLRRALLDPNRPAQ